MKSPHEISVNDYNRGLERRGIAWVQKVPDPVKIIKTGSGGSVRGVLDVKKFCDHQGFFLDGGRSIVIEDKETNQASLRRGAFSKRPHQLALLSLAWQAGALAIVIVYSSRKRASFCIPAPILVDMPLNFDHLGPFRLDDVAWYEWCVERGLV